MFTFNPNGADNASANEESRLVDSYPLYARLLSASGAERFIP